MAEHAQDGPPDLPGHPHGDLRWLREAIELSKRCPPSPSAFSVGAVLVSNAGSVITTGYSRETDPKNHAEEIALARAAGDPRVVEATLYSSLEPCVARASRPHCCAELIVKVGVPRVVAGGDHIRGSRMVRRAVLPRAVWLFTAPRLMCMTEATCSSDRSR